MKGIALVLRALYDGERGLEQSLLTVADRHGADHEVHHVATDIARWSHDHAERVARAAESHGLHLPETAPLTPRRQAPAPDDAAADPGVLLLLDLRELHLAAAKNALDWQMLSQAAQAAGESGLVDLAAECRPQTVRQMSWTDTMLKTLSPQLLTSL
ncbi:hypothetical protein [Streptomyces sp. V3I7]|uniref:hypothetical protein n=1 Tax=Streptomyces sp. V3I7 TaxID=3042278 RepID=UPI00278B8BCB|nr:hypothetical protein [Streptomyces sp. V3I7]MDQ0989465.1 hypothetical protein [Streptomyces sp. V3I7]